jgi:hypothetical protein
VRPTNALQSRNICESSSANSGSPGELSPELFTGGVPRLNSPRDAQPSQEIKTRDRYYAMEPFQVYKLYRATASEVRRFGALVREGKELDQALWFCNWLDWAGVVDILKSYQELSAGEIDAHLLAHSVKELQSNVREWYVGRKKPVIHLAEIEAINRKLDLIARHLFGEQSVVASISAKGITLHNDGEPGRLPSIAD